MEYMKTVPDKYFELAIVDPPYGINYDGDDGLASKGKVKRQNGTYGTIKRKLHTKKNWDNETPNEDYFKELFRVSKNQIIWGGNYFTLPPTKGIICWDKKQMFPTFSRWEYAWTSFDCVARLFEYDNKGFMCKDGVKIHPTQKPIKLYKWLLKQFAKMGDRILDTHVGSGSSLIACKELGFDYVGCEIDHDYFEAAQKRINKSFRKYELFEGDKDTIR